MRVVPDKQDERIAFYEIRLANWEARAAQIGLSSEEVAQLAEAVAATRAALTAARVARAAARTATQWLKEADEAMATLGAVALLKIRGTARVKGDEVYTLASVSVPKPPSRMGPPGKPENFQVELTTLGWLALRWTCDQPAGAAGTMYQVHRRLGEGKPFEYVGTAGERKYVDTSVPAGTASVTYQVRAVRSKSVGPWATFNVNLGSTGWLPSPFTPNSARAA
jgi:hypothetical protein